MYNKNKDRFKESVELALKSYYGNKMNVPDGVDVLRYAQKGFLKSIGHVEEILHVLKEYHENPQKSSFAYIILNYAHDGLLEYRIQE